MTSNAPRRPRMSSGFTLVEMMVALFIFALLSLAGVMMLQTAVATNEITDTKISSMANMQRFVSLMEADLSQAIPRPYRDEAGQTRAAFSSDGKSVLLNFTRGGHSNLNARPRSALRVVTYRLDNNKLQRISNDAADGSAANGPARLLENISALEIRFRDESGAWLNSWQSQRLTDMPRAVDIRFTQDSRSYRHVFLVGTGYL